MCAGAFGFLQEGLATMIKTRLMILGAALVLAGGLALAADDEKPADVINKQADKVGKSDWETASKAGADIAKKHELLDVMNLLKLRNPAAKVQGMGVGKVPGAIKPDGIEAKIISLTKVPMIKATLEKQQADLIRMAEITAAIASVATHQPTVTEKQGKKDPKVWKELSKDMYESSKELIKALKDKDTVAVKNTANKLNGTCTECHSNQSSSREELRSLAHPARRVVVAPVCACIEPRAGGNCSRWSHRFLLASRRSNSMRSLRTWIAAVCALALLTSARAEDKKENTAIKPAMKDKGRHDKFVEIAKRGGVDVLFLGDSITDAWGGEGHGPRSAGAAIFEKEFKPLKAANFGIGGDRTQHVLWRLQNGELEGIQPKVVMLMIGTNNLSSNTPEEIAEGVTAVVKEIHKKSPKTKVLLLGIFPRSAKASDPIREKLGKVNEIIAKLDDGGKTVKYLDIGKKFLEEDGTLTRKIMPDLLHLSPEGYQIWADAVKKPIEELLGK